MVKADAIDGRIQLLQTAKDKDIFVREYGRDLFGETQEQFSSCIMWEEVADDHSGIIIDPYSRSRSRIHLWYFGWNCAGEYIWNTSIIRLSKLCEMKMKTLMFWA